MKLVIKFLVICSLLISSVQAVTFDVLVLPTDLVNSKENYYGFEEVSEIIAEDIINDFNSSNGKIQSPELYEVRNKMTQDAALKTLITNTLKKYDRDSVDYKALKEIGKNFSCKSVLLVSSSVITNKNSLKRGLWEVLEVSTAFNLEYPYRLDTSMVLIDTVNDIVMWSNRYSTKIGTNIAAKSASQNIILRFYPKTLRTINKEFDNSDGGALKFDRTIPQQPAKNESPDEEFFGDMIYGI